jgi:sugar lactone lactonase YvrE
MNSKTIISMVFSAMVLLWPLALYAQPYSEVTLYPQVFSDLNMTDPENWNVNASPLTPSTPFDYKANWGVSYTSSLGVPQDPYSTSTTALQLKVNETSEEQAGVSVSPVSLVLSNSFVMTFDMWLNYNSGGFTQGSTQVGSYGIAVNSSTPTWAGVGNGQLFGELTDDGLTVDYRGYNNGVTIGSGPFVAGSQNETNGYYTGLFPSVAVPASETTNDDLQYGVSYPGTISFQWVKVNVTYNTGLLSESINGHLIASYTNASIGSDIFLGLYDVNNGSAGSNGFGDQNYVLFDNVNVEPGSTIPIPSTFSGIAGSTNNGSVDGVGTNAEFYSPQGTAVDTNYNVYVADTGNSTIRRLVFTNGNWQVSTIAGTPTNSGSADGANGFARFRNPEGITVDHTGNLYVADTANSTIRMLFPVGTNWVVSTLAGLAGTNGSADGTNGMARFNNPQGIAVDHNGNLYVADTLNDTIRMMTPIGTNWVVSTIAGSAGIIGTNDGTNSLAQFYSPEGIAVDGAGKNVYVADTTNDIIRQLSLVGTNWTVSTIAGLAGYAGSTDGTNSNARFDDPGGIAMDRAGNLYVADTVNNTIREIIPASPNWVVTTVAGLAGTAGQVNGTGTNALFTDPKGIAIDLSGNLFVDGAVEEGISLSGGVDLLADNFASGDQYWINVKLGPPSATNAGAAWGLDGDPPNSLSSAPGYTRYFTTTSQALQFASVTGWNEPNNPPIQVPAGIASVIVTNLNYTVVPPVLSVSLSNGLGITGTANTQYNIQFSRSSNGPWTLLKSVTLPNNTLYQIEPSPGPWPWPVDNAPATFYRAVWISTD